MTRNPRATPYLLFGQFAAFGALALPDRSGGKRPGAARRAGGILLVATGVALAAAGALALGPKLRPTPAPPAGVVLRTSGPYALSRHPIYTGLVLSAVGRTMWTGGRRHLGAALALGGIFAVKAHYEESLLGGVFDYELYRRSVPRWGIGPRKN